MGCSPGLLITKLLNLLVELWMLKTNEGCFLLIIYIEEFLNKNNFIMSHEKSKQQANVKKKATKTLKEKRAAKKTKKAVVKK